MLDTIRKVCYTNIVERERKIPNTRKAIVMKKISYKDYAILLGYKKNHMFERFACNHYIDEHDTCVKVISKVKMPVYIALFVPACIFQAVALMWDGGLSNFTIDSPTYSTHIVWKESSRYANFLKKRA